MRKNVSSTERGYGTPHVRRRRQLLAQHIDGAPCDVCKKPMFIDAHRNWDRAPLEADHPPGHAQKYATNKKGNLPQRLLHRHCNRSGGAWDRTPPPIKPHPDDRSPGSITAPFKW